LVTNNLYISTYESATYQGYLSFCVAKILADIGNNFIIENVPDFNGINIPRSVEYTMPEKGSIDKIIQYLPLSMTECIKKYHNIIVYNPRHFITKNQSIKNKLKKFDEIWVWDKNSKIFLSDIIDADKITIKGYPYNPSLLFNNVKVKKKTNENIVTYYTIVDETQLENIETLIFNFLATFYKNNNSRLSIYIDHNYKDDKALSNKITSMINNIKDNLSFIRKHIIDSLITIQIGNIWVDPINYAQFHEDGDCYVNIDYLINPHALIAYSLNKYSISISNIGEVLDYNPNTIVQTYRASFRQKVDSVKTYINEFNLYPKLLDESIKEKFIMIYQYFMSKTDPGICYKSLNSNKFFNYDNNL